MRYDRARQSLDRHATYIVATFFAGTTAATRPRQRVAADVKGNGALSTPGRSVTPIRRAEAASVTLD